MQIEKHLEGCTKQKHLEGCTHQSISNDVHYEVSLKTSIESFHTSKNIAKVNSSHNNKTSMLKVTMNHDQTNTNILPRWLQDECG